MKFFAYTMLTGLSLAMLGGCSYSDKSKRNLEYAPNMFYSIPLEAYKQGEKNTVFENGLSSQKPPAGTVPRSESWYVEEAYTPYPYDNTFEGYEAAGNELDSPLDKPSLNDPAYNCTSESYENGKRLYQVYCVMCHGPNGQGKGNLVTSGKFGAVPAYTEPDRINLPVGKMFHTLTYGKGIMGSYASQMTPKERWEVICYIQEFMEAGRADAGEAVAAVQE